MKKAVLLSSVLVAALSASAAEYRGLPSEYVQVESISSTGAQYIDTGVVAGPDVSAVLDFTPLEYTGNVNIGTTVDDAKDWRFFNYNDGSMFDIGSQRIGYNSETKLTNGNRYTVSIGNSYLTITREDGTQKWTDTKTIMGANDIAAYNIFICANNNGSGAASKVRMTIHSLVMSNSVDGIAQCVRDFVPCYRLSDKEPGLYDLVNNVFYTDGAHSATKFTVGEEVVRPDVITAVFDSSSISAWRATLAWRLSVVGDNATTADYYFAYGTDPDALTPALAASGIAMDETATVSLTGLAATTTYYYASYWRNDQGAVSETQTGSFTTSDLAPLTASVVTKFTGTERAALEAQVSRLGEEGESATFYFAKGLAPDNLTPVAITNGLAAGETFDIAFTGLTSDTTYYYAYYAVNDLGQASETYTGMFTTTDGSVPRWVGAVSQNWSDGENWDSGVAPVAGTTYGQIILEQPYGCFPPSNVDVAGLAVTTVVFGNQSVGGFTVVGLPLSLRECSNEDGAAYTVTFENDIAFIGQGRDKTRSGMTTVYAGSVSGTQGFYSEQAGTVAFFGDNSGFSGQIYNNSGNFRFYGEENLGQPPAEPTEDALLNQGWCSMYVMPRPDRHLNVVTLDANRGLRGPLGVRDGVELRTDGLLCNDFRIDGETESWNRHVFFGGSMKPNGGQVQLRGNIIAHAMSATAFGDGTRRLYSYRAGVWDFNGFSSPSPITHYSEGNYHANFINNDLEHPVTLSGKATLSLDQGTALFGGAGEIVHTGDMDYDRTDCALRKNGSGALTLAGETYDWEKSVFLHGGTATFDYRAHNTAKPLGSGTTVGNIALRFLGNEEEKTSVSLNTLTEDFGYVTLETVPGSQGLELTLGNIPNRQHDRALDLRFGAGTDVVLSGDTLVNTASFGGLNPNITWDHGRTWAWVDEDNATLGPLPASCFSSVQELGKVWDVPSGESISGSDKIIALRFADPSGPATLTINNGWELTADSALGCSVAILISPEVGGDVTLNGTGYLRPTGGNTYLSIHNYSTNHVTRISTRLEYNNNNGLNLFGPGTTIVDNDSNGFFNGPHIFGGGTLQFTSIKDNGRSDWNAQRSSLGNAYYNREIGIGDGSTLEYIGTTPEEGPSSDRIITIYGTSTLKNSGTGTLHFTNTGTFCSAGVQACRLVLDGEGDGIIDGAVNPGDCGWIEKRGTGTWTLTSSASVYDYPAKVLAGTLRVTGALPGGAVVEEGATLAFGEGALVKRHLESRGTIRYEVDADAVEHAPVTVWGTIALGGDLQIAGHLHESTTILTAENGVTGEFASIPESVVVRVVGNDVIIDPALPTVILFR